MAAGPRQPACTEGIRLDCDDSRAAELRLGAAVFVSVYLYYHLPPSLPPALHPSFLPSIPLPLKACGPRGPRLVAAADAVCRDSQHGCRARRARAGSGPAVRSIRAESQIGSNPAGAAKGARAGLARRLDTIARPAQPVAAGGAECSPALSEQCTSGDSDSSAQAPLLPPRVVRLPAAAPHGVARRGALCRNAAAALFSSVLRDLPGRSRPGSW